MICLRTLGIRGAQEKSAAKKRMGGVGDFDLDVRRLGHGGWVVERGINPTTLLDLALGLTPLSMRQIGAVIAPLSPGK